MIMRFLAWFRNIPQRRAAVASAVNHFESTKSTPAHRGISSVIAKAPEGYVVRVCYGHIKPPGRAWFLVSAEGSIIAELSFDQVKQHGEEMWR